MKNVALSVLVVLVLGTVLVATLSMFEITKEAAKPIVGGIPLAIPAVHQMLQKSGSRLSLSARKRGVVSFHGYTMPLIMLALYGILIVFAASELAGFFTGVAVGAAGLGLEYVSQFWMLAMIPTMMVAYLVGTWIGGRSESKGLFAILAIALCVPFLDRVLGLVLMSRQDLLTMFQAKNTTGPLLIGGAVNCVLIAVFAGLGYWRGRVVQSSRYSATYCALFLQRAEMRW
jgi:hypothetical protein